jgi:hypothetical protein
MILVSIVMVFGALALIGVNLTADTPVLKYGAGLIIQGKVPWMMLAGLWGGVALGVASLFRRHRLPKLGVVLVEISLVAYVSWYVVAGSAIPPHGLAIDVGSSFPAYALQDQDGALHKRAALEKRPAALYIFYRGHW